MQIQRLLHISLFLCLVLTGPALGQNGKPVKAPVEKTATATSPAAAKTSSATAAVKSAATTSAKASIDFDGTVKDGAKAITIRGATGLVSVYVAQKGTACGKGRFADLPSRLDLTVTGTAGTTTQVKFDPGSSSTVNLANPAKAGDLLCLVDLVADASGGFQAHFSAPASVGAAATATAGPKFADSTLVTGSDTVWVQGSKGDSIEVFSFPANYKPQSKAAGSSGQPPCTQADFGGSNPKKLSFIQRNAAGAASTATELTLNSNEPLAIQLQSPLQLGSLLCIDDQPKSGSEEFSSFAAVQNASEVAGGEQFSSTPSVSFLPAPVTLTKSVWVKGTTDDVVTIYAFNSDYKSKTSILSSTAEVSCTSSDVDSAPGLLTAAGVKLKSSDPQEIDLASALTAGEKLCIEDHTANGADKFSYLATVQDAPTGTLGGETPPAAPLVSFDSSPWRQSKSVSVKGKAGVIDIYAFKSDYKPKHSLVSTTGEEYCGLADLENATDRLASSATLTGTDAQTIPLLRALKEDERLCIVDQPSSGNPEFSYLATVQKPSPPRIPRINGGLESGSKTISVDGEPGSTVAFFQFDQTADTLNCDKVLQEQTPTQGQAQTSADGGTQLEIAKSGSSSSTYTATLDSTPGPYTVNLSSPLIVATQICVRETVTPKGGTATPSYSTSAPVSDANNPFAHVRTFYTAGAMINNQNGSNSGSSSTGTEYLDLGLAFSLAPKVNTGHTPGLDTSISGRFSAVPVAAPSTAPSTAATSSTNNGTLNILSSQESFRVLGAIAVPFRTWKGDDQHSFFSAPVLKAGFDTLLNPSATGSSSSSTSTTSATATFAPVYSEYSAGYRMGYRKYPARKEGTPQTITQVDITLGRYSNLQSYVCGASESGVTSTTEPTNTICFTPQTPNAGSYILEKQTRITLSRVEVEGFFSFPKTPFVLGLDANLPQSLRPPKNLDLANKPGGNVAIYFGVSGSLTSFFNNLKLAGSPQ